MLDTATRLSSQIPAGRLADKLPHRDRTYLQLCNHLAEIPRAIVAVGGGARFGGSLAAAEPDVLLGPGVLAESMRATLVQIDHWWVGYGDRRCSRPVDTPAGQQSLHRVIERVVWHVAQHTRQLAMVVELCDVAPDRPLVEAQLRGLPLPVEVWDV